MVLNESDAIFTPNVNQILRGKIWALSSLRCKLKTKSNSDHENVNKHLPMTIRYLNLPKLHFWSSNFGLLKFNPGVCLKYTADLFHYFSQHGNIIYMAAVVCITYQIHVNILVTLEMIKMHISSKCVTNSTSMLESIWLDFLPVILLRTFIS